MSWYLMYKGWMDHPVFERENFTQREAWEWLISNAIWRDEGMVVSVNNNPVHVPRGCLCHSLRYLANAWGWHKNRVRRFLDKLETWQMIETATGTGQVMITICNYSKYQFAGTATGTPTGTEAGQDRDTSGTNKKEGKEGKEGNNTRAHAREPDGFDLKPDGVDEQTWRDFLKLRKAKKAPITSTAVKMLKTEAEKAGWSLQSAVEEAVARGWQSFKAHYVADQKSNSSGKQPVCL